MEENIPHPREAQGPTVAQPAPAVVTPRDDALAPVAQLLSSTGDDESSDDEGELELEVDFEFPFVCRDSPAGTAAPADELFADGRIRAFYPVFGRGTAGCVPRGGGGGGSGSCCTALPAAPPRVRGQLGRLFQEETRERSSSASFTASSGPATDDEDGGLDGAAPGSYCVWRPGPSASASPSPPPPRKSGSTGSMARWRRISDLVVGRSHSDGRDKFLFLAAAPRRGPKDKEPAATAPPAVAAHQMAAYLARGVPPRRTFLPYREELVGFFANVNGISRSHHRPPF